ncbi:hypothetical protein [Oryza sativa Japonica Group]|uniref:Uncharacterized protein P0025A05.16 n=1 Tax=Oryza sativa subsp. japonica TaxID=39947 RepID=Q5ZAE9_ORYSJ|nr:hypothetical protein [Oryza sativa Japonica Group]
MGVWRLGVASIPAGREGEWGGMWSRGGRGLESTPVGTRGGAGSAEGVGGVADGWSWPEVGDDRWGPRVPPVGERERGRGRLGRRNRLEGGREPSGPREEAGLRGRERGRAGRGREGRLGPKMAQREEGGFSLFSFYFN